MLKWVLMGIVLISGLAAFAVLRFGLKPRPIRQINPTAYENLASVGAASFRRVPQEWAPTRLVVLINSENEADSSSVWKGWLKTAMVESPGVVTHEVEVSDLGDLDLEFLSERLQKNQRLVIRWNPNTRHLKELNEQTASLGEELGVAPFVVVQQSSVVRENQLGSLSCDSEDETLLPCIGARYSKIYFRKKLPIDQIVAGMERHGRFLYVLFVYKPQEPEEER